MCSLKVTRQNCLNGSSSRIEESMVPTACMRHGFWTESSRIIQRSQSSSAAIAWGAWTWLLIDLISNQEPWRCQLSTPMKHSRLFRGTWLVILACCGDTHGKNGLEKFGRWLARAHRRPTSCFEGILCSRPAQRRRSWACQVVKRSFTELWGVLVERWSWRVSRRTCHWRSRQSL